MDKVLIVTYYWPPSGGAGVQRWLKFSKYLPEFGWEPFILTVDQEFAAYPVTDFSLKDDIPPSLKVYTTPSTNYFSIYKKDKSRIPSAGFANNVDITFKGKLLRFARGNFFLPDPRRGWNKYAFRKASEIIEKEGIKHLITTSPPHSTQLIGLKLKKRNPDLKWIADLRDPWTDIYYYHQFYPTFFSKYIDRKYEKSVLKKSDKIITVGASLKNLFSLKIKGIGCKTEVITNGYDEDDFSGIAASNPSLFTITYVGTLSDTYPVEGFLNALTLFKAKGNELILRLIGKISQNQKELILSKTRDSNLEFIQYIEHPEAVRYMLKTSVLLLIIPDHQSNKSIITGKLFEYLATGKPIICIGPVDGDAARIIESTGHGRTFFYNDSHGVSEYLSSLISDLSIHEKMSPISFSRRELTGKIVQLLTAQDY
jgi:glycosyltransferase involved in cell wall biosynthesis